jgi:hypothetical protein
LVIIALLYGYLIKSIAEIENNDWDGSSSNAITLYSLTLEITMDSIEAKE